MRKTKSYKRLPYNPKLKERAQELRQAGMLHEAILWNELKRKQLNGLDFDRQKVIGNYIVDFYCAEKNVVIEIDGSSHENKVEYDRAREAYLTCLGLMVIHIYVEDVLRDLGSVMEYLRNHPALSGPL